MILTPGIKAPVASATVPFNVALIPTCADADMAKSRHERKRHALREPSVLIQLSPFSCDWQILAAQSYIEQDGKVKREN
jgi:hypothetical protein